MKNIPTPQEFYDVAIRSLNLTWDILCKLYVELEEYGGSEEFNLSYAEYGYDENTNNLEAYWILHRGKLENCIVLLMQAIEFYLKGKLSEESPFLLLSSKEAWGKKTDFLELHTIDAKDLIDKCNAICGDGTIGTEFKGNFESIRTKRNRIIHMGILSTEIDPETILHYCKFFYAAMNRPECWEQNRVNYLEQFPDPYFINANLILHLKSCLAIAMEIKPSTVKKLWEVQKKSNPHIHCPYCIPQLHSDTFDLSIDNLQSVYRVEKGKNTFRCIACYKTVKVRGKRKCPYCNHGIGYYKKHDMCAYVPDCLNCFDSPYLNLP